MMSTIVNATVCCAIVMFAAASACAAGPAPTWTNVTPWGRPVSGPQQARSAARIVQFAAIVLQDSSEAKFAEQRHMNSDGYRAMQALALMQALPYLNDTTSPKYADVKQRAAELSNGVIQRTMPEFWKELEPSSPKLVPDVMGEKSYLSGTDVGRKNYATPIILMMVEYRLAGGLQVAPLKQTTPSNAPAASQPYDRSGRIGLNPSLAAKQGIARMMCGVLASGEEFPPKEIQPKSLWEYTSFGLGPEKTCYSKSSTAVFGLRAAWNMAGSPLEFPPEAFKFSYNGTGQISRENLVDALADALFQSVLCTTEVEVLGGALNSDQRLGLVGQDAYQALFAEKKVSRNPAEVFAEPFDVLKYRTLHAVNDGRPIYRIQYANVEGLRERGQPEVAMYRYLPHAGNYGAYHTASAAYVNVTCANLCVQLISGMPLGNSIGKTHRIERDSDRSWKVETRYPGAAPRRFTIELDEAPRKYTALVVKDAMGRELPINDRIAAALNATVMMLTNSVAPDKVRGLETSGAPAAWQRSITLGDGAHPNTLVGFASYGVMKACLACGHSESLGPWPWKEDLAKAVCDSADFTQPSDTGNPAFGLLILTDAYRPIFPQTQTP